MGLNFKIRDARKNEAMTLSEIAVSSKAYWGYSKEFMSACTDELTVRESQISSHWVAESGERILGFYALDKIVGSHFELDALFVHPNYIGIGVGRALFEHSLIQSANLGATKLFIQSDPYAASFYESTGAILVGEKESGSIPGRMLPKFEVAISAK